MQSTYCVTVRTKYQSKTQTTYISIAGGFRTYIRRCSVRINAYVNAPVARDRAFPRHIWYVKANGLHGDRFAIEFKTESYVWRTTSSKKVSLNEKLNQAKQKLVECYALYPHLNPHNPDWLAKQKELTDSYENILIAATLPEEISALQTEAK